MYTKCTKYVYLHIHLIAVEKPPNPLPLSWLIVSRVKMKIHKYRVTQIITTKRVHLILKVDILPTKNELKNIVKNVHIPFGFEISDENIMKSFTKY